MMTTKAPKKHTPDDPQEGVILSTTHGADETGLPPLTLKEQELLDELLKKKGWK